MAISRTIMCDRCGSHAMEPAPNAGWSGWASIQGVRLNGVDNPNICPRCVEVVMRVIDEGGE